MTHRAHHSLFALAFAICAACGAADSDGGIASDCYDDASDCVDPAGEHFTYIVDSLSLPASAQDAQRLGVNLDGDEFDQIDNQLGSVIQGLGNFADVDLQAEIDRLIADGTLLLVVDVQSRELGSANDAGISLRVGVDPSPAPCSSDTDEICGHHLQGDGTIGVDDNAPIDATLAARLSSGTLLGGPGAATATVDFMELLPIAPVTLNSVGTKVRADIDAGGIEGVIGGAVSESEVRQIVLPIISELAAADCAGTAPECCTPESIGEAIVNIFDSDADCAVTITELEDSTLLAGFLVPDVDLLDADGRYAPLSDGANDSFSLGAGFTAVPIEITE